MALRNGLPIGASLVEEVEIFDEEREEGNDDSLTLVLGARLPLEIAIS